MPILLHLDSSARGERSISRQLTREFADAWKKANPAGSIIYRDLGHNPVPLVNEPWIEASFSPPDGLTPELKSALAVSDELISELEKADHYVFGVPMYNFSAPAAFKAYIDQIVRVGRTCNFSASGFEGLLKGKKVIIITSSGSVFRKGTPLESLNYQEPWLRTILGFIGLTEVEFIVADGLNDVNFGKVDREQYLSAIRLKVLEKAGWPHISAGE